MTGGQEPHIRPKMTFAGPGRGRGRRRGRGRGALPASDGRDGLLGAAAPPGSPPTPPLPATRARECARARAPPCHTHRDRTWLRALISYQDHRILSLYPQALVDSRIWPRVVALVRAPLERVRTVPPEGVTLQLMEARFLAFSAC